MSLRVLPPHVRAHLYMFWAGAITAGLGIVGFFLSFGEVASPEQATIDVHYDVPVLAYASIAAWVVGLVLMWYSRRRIDAAVRAKQAENREQMFADFGVQPQAAEAAPALVEPTEEER